MIDKEREAWRTRPVSKFSHSYQIHISGGRKALWSFRFGRYSPSGVAGRKFPVDTHLKESDTAEVFFLLNNPKLQRLSWNIREFCSRWYESIQCQGLILSLAMELFNNDLFMAFTDGVNSPLSFWWFTKCELNRIKCLILLHYTLPTFYPKNEMGCLGIWTVST